MRTLGFQVVAQNPLRYRLIVMAALGAADIANKVDHNGLDDGRRNPGRLIGEYLLRPHLRVSVACPERAQASRTGALCGCLDPYDPSAALGISLADSRSPSGSLTPAEQLNFTAFPAANYTRGFTAAVKERLRRCQKQPR